MSVHHNKNNRKFKCPYCENKYEREKLVNHIDKIHNDMIPENYTSARIVFNLINKKETGHCVMCGKETEWDESKWRYKRICSEECKDKYVEMRNERMIKVRGTTNMLTDMEHQKKMLSHRKISGTYKFTDGGVLSYVGNYEKQFLEFMDKVMEFSSNDIISPGHIIKYKFNGEDLSFITDFYLIPFNLLFDIKAGGDNPNTHPGMKENREKQKAKEEQIRKDGKYNYIRLTNNNFSQLISILMDIKFSLIDENNNEKVIHINEDVSNNNIIMIDNDTNFKLIAYSENGMNIDGLALYDQFNTDKIYIENNGKIIKEDFSFLKDKYYTIYKVNNSNKNIINNLKEEYVETNSIIYKLCTGSELTSFEQLKYDVRLETSYISDISDNSTYKTRLNELIKYVLMYEYTGYIPFPIMNNNDIMIKNKLLTNFEDLDIYEDVDGYFVYNKKTDKRSMSFENINNINIELLENMNLIKI